MSEDVSGRGRDSGAGAGLMTGDTIAAIATAPGGALGVVRVSGPEARAVVAALLPEGFRWPPAREVRLARLRDRQGGALDEALVLRFEALRSATGEEVVELHCHGGERLLQRVIEELLAGGLARPAGRGEFTRRAFLNGRIGLDRAEAISELVAAQSAAEVQAAAAQLAGGLERRVRPLLDEARELWADVEAVLGFPDEADEVEATFPERLGSLAGRLERLAERGRSGRLARRGARVLLFGPVNAGKSTLFNRLLEEERALVDETPGTTRDLLEARWELGGRSLTLLDGAGMRAGAERLEAAGMARVIEAAKGVDLILLLLPRGAEESEWARWRALLPEGIERLEVSTKGDLTAADARQKRPGVPAVDERLFISALEGVGLEGLIARVSERLWPEGSEALPELAGQRHLEALGRASARARAAESALEHATLEVVGGELGQAVGALGELLGEGASERLLDDIFSRFCIGK